MTLQLTNCEKKMSNSNKRFIKENIKILQNCLEFTCKVEESKHLKLTISKNDVSNTLTLAKTTRNRSAKKKQAAQIARVLRSKYNIDCKTSDFFCDYAGPLF